MYEILQSATFYEWLSGLKDQQARMRIHARLDRVSLGNFGPDGHLKVPHLWPGQNPPATEC